MSEQDLFEMVSVVQKQYDYAKDIVDIAMDAMREANKNLEKLQRKMQKLIDDRKKEDKP